MQQSGTPLAGLLVELQQKQFQFCASGPALFLVFWCTQCSLNHPTGKSLVVLSRELRVDTPHSSLPYPSSHSAKCDECWFYRHQSQHFYCQLNCKVFRVFLVHILHYSMSPEFIMQPCNCYTSRWWSFKFISPSLHLAHILLLHLFQ
jgi:hypothetical protein